MTELLLLVGVLLLVAANGFFVAAEFALVRAREGRVEAMRDEGRRGAALVLAQIDKIDEYLSACQLGITMASLGHRLPGRARDREPDRGRARRLRSRTACRWRSRSRSPT